MSSSTGSYDAIVIGVGAMGSATCYQLARRGLRVLGLEQFDIPNPNGSSGGQSRLIRLAYYEHPDYVPLLRRAYENWDLLDQQLDQPVLHRTGCLYLGPPDGHLVRDTLRSSALHDLGIEQLDAGQLGERFPQFRVPMSFGALFEPEAGFVLCERAIAAFAELAMRAGAELHGRERVMELRTDGGGVTVRTDRGTYRAAELVLTAGAWSGALLGDLGIELLVSRQVVGWVWPGQPDDFGLGRFPCWAIQDDAPGFEGIYYGFPALPAGRYAGERGLKLGHHAVGRRVDPDTLDRQAGPEDELDFRPALDKYLPAAAGPTLAMRVCMYTLSPDEHFIVDRHPTRPHVTLACGFSGHGFKFASVMGEALADLATEGATTLPVGFLGLHRFADFRRADAPAAADRVEPAG